MVLAIRKIPLMTPEISAAMMTESVRVPPVAPLTNISPTSRAKRLKAPCVDPTPLVPPQIPAE